MSTYILTPVKQTHFEFNFLNFLRTVPVWFWAALGIALPYATHVLLPMAGVFVFLDKITPENITLLCGSALMAAVYFCYLWVVTKHPVVIVLFNILALRALIYVTQVLEAAGKHLPFRTIIIPSILLLVSKFSALNKTYSYFKYVFAFTALYLLYYVFYNHNFVNPSFIYLTTSSISKGQVFDYVFGILSLTATGCAFIKAKNQDERIKLFDYINFLLVVITIIESSLFIAGYPLNLFTMVVEGFRLSQGFLHHPNAYAKVAGMLAIYFIGLYCYYLKRPDAKLRLMKLLLPCAFLLNMFGLLLTLSKNAFLACAIGYIPFTALLLVDADIRKRVALPLGIIIGLMVVLVTGCAASGKSLFALLTDRFNDNRSAQWRFHAWEYLLSCINFQSIWLGHGLTAANIENFRFGYNFGSLKDKGDVLVHCATIQYLFDMGILGLLIFSGYLSASIKSIQEFIKGSYNPLYLTVVGLTLFVFICVNTDEAATDIQINILYWFMITMIFTFCSFKMKAIKKQIVRNPFLAAKIIVLSPQAKRQYG